MSSGPPETILSRLGGVQEVSAGYEQRWVAFIDILGWKDILDRTEGDNAIVQSIQSMFSEIENQVAYSFEIEKTTHPNYWPKISAISDSVIISFPRDFTASLFFSVVYKVQQLILLHGVLSRGAITIGSIVHTSYSAFGPALARAYLLESNLAKMPRVIIDQECERMYFEHTDNLEYCCQQKILFRDSDGYLTVDYLRERFLANNAPWEDGKMPLSQIRSYIVDYSMHYSHIQSVREKIDWIVAYFNTLVDEIRPEGVESIEI